MSTFRFVQIGFVFLLLAVFIVGFFAFGVRGGSFLQLTLDSNPDLRTNLLLHYRFDGPDIDLTNLESIVLDVSGNANHLRSSSGIDSSNITSGRIGQGLVEPGEATSTVSLPTGDFTYAFWVKPADSSEAILFSNTDSPTDANSEIVINILAGLVSVALNGGSADVISATSISSGEWHHVAVRRSGSAIDIFVNGEEDANSGTDSATLDFGTCPLEFFVAVTAGSGCNAAVSTITGGKIDDFRIYGSALSTSTIQRVYGLGSTTYIGLSSLSTTEIDRTITTNPNLENGLWAHYTFDGPNIVWADSASIKDRSSNARHLTPENPPSADDVVAGYIGQAISFDGSSADLNIPSVSAPTGDFTYAFWAFAESLNNTIITQDDVGSDNELRIATNSSGNVLVYTNNTLRLTTTGSITSNEWTHVVVRRSGSDIEVFFNGSVDATTGSDAGTLAFNCSLYVGRNSTSAVSCDSGVPNGYFDGRLDDLRIYNRAISDTELTRLYQLAR